MKETLPLFATCTFALLALPLTAGDKVIATFEKEGSADAWYSVNDDVMGGISTGACKRTDDGTLKFAGSLSLENNGGFASIRTKTDPLDLSGLEAVTIEVKGDGRTYWVDMRGPQQIRASSYRAFMETTADEWQQVVIPFQDFKLQAFGEQVPGPALNLEKVSSFGFTIADKNSGPFQLEVKSIKATAENTETAETEKQAEKGTTIAAVAQQAGTFKTLLAAAEAADLVGALAGQGPLTVFAPTDEAFAKLPKGTVEELLKPANKDTLASILTYHVVSGKIELAKALEVGTAATLQGATLTVKFDEGRVQVGTATLLKANITASNGVIHVIDEVLLPPSNAPEPLSPQALIELAIDRGVPLFNGGNEDGCAAVYEIACEALRVMPGVDEDAQATLSEAIQEARAEDGSLAKSWILRRALDATYLSVESK